MERVDAGFYVFWVNSTPHSCEVVRPSPRVRRQHEAQIDAAYESAMRRTCSRVNLNSMQSASEVPREFVTSRRDPSVCRRATQDGPRLSFSG